VITPPDRAKSELVVPLNGWGGKRGWLIGDCASVGFGGQGGDGAEPSNSRRYGKYSTHCRLHCILKLTKIRMAQCFGAAPSCFSQSRVTPELCQAAWL
jgi:hypothetical protein